MAEPVKSIEVANVLKRKEYLPSIDEYVRKLIDTLPDEMKLVTTYADYEIAYVKKFYEMATNIIFNNIIMRKFKDGARFLDIACCGNMTNEIIDGLLKEYHLVIEAPYDTLEPLEIYQQYFEREIIPKLKSSQYTVSNTYSSITIDGKRIKLLHLIVKWQVGKPLSPQENEDGENEQH